MIAVGDGRRFDVEFKKMDDEKLITLFTDTFHYIHQKRTRGDSFGLFFKGDRYPWAVETTERSIYARQYKRMALLAHGFHPNKGIELTRLHTLPGSPLNAISILDGLVKDYYKDKDIQVIFTKTMPSYSKSKSTTISGGLNNVLCANELEHFFVKIDIDKHECWEHVSRRWIEDNNKKEFKCSTESFGLLPAVDVYTEVNPRQLSPISAFQDGDNVIYFSKKDMGVFTF